MPKVTIAHPAAHAPVGERFRVRGNAQEISEMKSAKITHDKSGTCVDGTLSSYLAPNWIYSFVLDAKSFPEGPSTIEVIGTGTDGNDYSDKRGVVVKYSKKQTVQQEKPKGTYGDPTITYPEGDPYVVSAAEAEYFYADGTLDAQRNVYVVKVDDEVGFHDEDSTTWWATFAPLTPGIRVLTVIDNTGKSASKVLNIQSS